RRPACCPRLRRQQASRRKRHGQLSRESEIFVICVYCFGSVFYEANEPSSTCRLRFKLQVEASTPPYLENNNISECPSPATSTAQAGRSSAPIAHSIICSFLDGFSAV